MLFSTADWSTLAEGLLTILQRTALELRNSGQIHARKAHGARVHQGVGKAWCTWSKARRSRRCEAKARSGPCKEYQRGIARPCQNSSSSGSNTVTVAIAELVPATAPAAAAAAAADNSRSMGNMRGSAGHYSSRSSCYRSNSTHFFRALFFPAVLRNFLLSEFSLSSPKKKV